MIRYRLGLTRVTIDDTARRVTTVFDTGGRVLAAPVPGVEHVARARALGYQGSDPEVLWAMCRDHDLLHTVLAVNEGYPWSATLHAVGHRYQLPPGLAEAEERRVFVVQRMLNEGLAAVARPAPEAVADDRYDPDVPRAAPEEPIAVRRVGGQPLDVDELPSPAELADDA